jgi:Polysaccharide biosynthesis C-terminal domain
LTPSFGLKGAAGAVTLAAFASMVPAFWLALKVLDLPLRDLVTNVERPAACSLPLAVSLIILSVPTAGLAAGIQLLVLVISGVGVYAASASVLARGELRAITAAFRSS